MDCGQHQKFLMPILARNGLSLSTFGGSMTSQRRLSILLDSEIKDLYGVPQYSLDEQRVYFSLNDIEERTANSIRNRAHRCFFTALLGYFKTKPVVLSPSYGDVEKDIKFIAQEIYPDFKFKRFSLTQKQKDRFYQKVFILLNYNAWDNTEHELDTLTYLKQVAKSCIEPRYVFDACIDYLAQKHIAIPRYTALQRLVSQSTNYERERIITSLTDVISSDLSTKLMDLVDDNAKITLSKLRKSAKSFCINELQKELDINYLINPWMSEINQVIPALSLSLKKSTILRFIN